MFLEMMASRFFFSVLLFVSFLCRVYATDTVTFSWPLEKNFGISGTFGESRGDHFHAGIDLSTNGETGLPVLAVADGLIQRLKIQKRAYGRALYIQHANGLQSVYGHLERYSEELGLEQVYQKKVVEMNTKYVGDIFLDTPTPVHAGQIIAYTGESGAGLPHLHLEIRKDDTDPINPLLNGFHDELDPVPPTFQACYLYPLTAESRIDTSPETQEVRLINQDGTFHAEKTPVIRGDFMVSVSVYDSALRPYRRAPASITYAIDQKQLYSLQFDRFSYNDGRTYGLVYDQGKPGPSYYEYPVILSKLGESVVPFVQSSLPFYTKWLAAGVHRLSLEAKDAAGNVSTAYFDFIVNRPPEIEMEQVTSDGKNLVLSTLLSDPDWGGSSGFPGLTAEAEYSINGGKDFLPFPGTSLDLQPPAGHARFLNQLPYEYIHTKRLIVRARGYDGVEYSAYALASIDPGIQPQFVSMPAAAGKLRWTWISGAVRLIYDSKDPLVSAPQLVDGSGASYQMQRWEPASFETVVRLPQQSGPLQIGLAGQTAIPLPVNFLRTQEEGKITGENFEIRFEQNTLYWNTFVWTKSIPAYRSRTLPLIGPMLQIGPRGLPMKNSAVLSFRYPAGLHAPERLNIYGWNRARQKWESIPTRISPETKTAETKISFFDLYALIQDNAPPTLTPIFPRRNSRTSNNKPRLAVKILDEGSDVDDEKVFFSVDGVSYPAEYDPDRNTAVLNTMKPLKRGYHKFRAYATDYAGNKNTTSLITFRVM